MINKKVMSVVTVLLLLCSLSFADEIILQNGTNGYSGCVDTYLYSIGDGVNFDFQYQNDNYHDAITTMTAN